MGQDLASRPTRIQLTLPLSGQSPIDVVMALRGLLRYRYHGDWQFQQGAKHLRTLARCVDRWAEVVLDQLRQPTKDEPGWNPASTAAELLAVRARMGGARMDSGVPLDERVDALFQDVDIPTEERGRAWTKLAETLNEAHEDLVEILEAHAWLRKGKRASTKVYDLAKFEHVLNSLQHHDALQAPFVAGSKAELREEYRPLYQPRRVVDQFLTQAVEEEVNQRKAWIHTVRDAFGDVDNIDEHVPEIDEALSQAREESTHRLFKTTGYDQYRALSRHVQEENILSTARSVEDLLDQWNDDAPLGQVLTALGEEHQSEFRVLTNYIETATSMLEAAHDGLESDIQMLRGGEDGVNEVIRSISTDLNNLDEAVRTVHDHADQ